MRTQHSRGYGPHAIDIILAEIRRSQKTRANMHLQVSRSLHQNFAFIKSDAKPMRRRIGRAQTAGSALSSSSFSLPPAPIGCWDSPSFTPLVLSGQENSGERSPAAQIPRVRQWDSRNPVSLPRGVTSDRPLRPGPLGYSKRETTRSCPQVPIPLWGGESEAKPALKNKLLPYTSV